MNQSVSTYRDLVAWQRGVAFSLDVYRATTAFPRSEKFGLVSQLRRAAVSIPSNIAEGYGRGKTNDYSRFLRVARGSLYEVETQLTIAEQLGYLGEQTFRELESIAKELGRILAGLIRSIENTSQTR